MRQKIKEAVKHGKFMLYNSENLNFSKLEIDTVQTLIDYALSSQATKVRDLPGFKQEGLKILKKLVQSYTDEAVDFCLDDKYFDQVLKEIGDLDIVRPQELPPITDEYFFELLKARFTGNDKLFSSVAKEVANIVNKYLNLSIIRDLIPLTQDKYTEIVTDLLEDTFPKGQCKERGQALVFIATLWTRLAKFGVRPQVSKKIDFEQFLMEKHAEEYVGTDDMMPDAFADWVQDLGADDVIRYGNLYAEQILTNLKG